MRKNVKLNGAIDIECEQKMQDDEEKLEKSGVLTLRKGGYIAAYSWNALRIQPQIRYELSKLSRMYWTIAMASSGQFLVPDFPIILYIPVHTTLCPSCSDNNLGNIVFLTRRDIVIINCQVAEYFREYYFANDFVQCFES